MADDIKDGFARDESMASPRHASYDDNDWNSYRLLVKDNFRRTEEAIKEIEAVAKTQGIDIAVLKTKAMLLGAAAGAVVTLAMRYLMKG
jgi:hypothetical protein